MILSKVRYRKLLKSCFTDYNRNENKTVETIRSLYCLEKYQHIYISNSQDYNMPLLVVVSVEKKSSLKEHFSKCLEEFVTDCKNLMSIINYYACNRVDRKKKLEERCQF